MRLFYSIHSQRSLKRFGIDVPLDDEKVKRTYSIKKAHSKLWKRHSCPCLGKKGQTMDKAEL